MREVFFNVSGDFGTISAGRTLALFGRQAILQDITLFGVGYLVGPDGGGTTLGRIGAGYVYPDFRTRFVYQTPDMNGFQLSVGIFDPQEPGGLLGGLLPVGVPKLIPRSSRPRPLSTPPSRAAASVAGPASCGRSRK